MAIMVIVGEENVVQLKSGKKEIVIYIKVLLMTLCKPNKRIGRPFMWLEIITKSRKKVQRAGG